MKQKHRLMWERRHGEVGTGMKAESAPAAEEQRLEIEESLFSKAVPVDIKEKSIVQSYFAGR